jgi:uncharacterized membrane protein
MATKSRVATFFKRGLRALLPTVLTIGVVVIVWGFFERNIVDPINDGIKALLVETEVGNEVMAAVFAIDVKAETYRIGIDHPDYRVGEDRIDRDKVRRHLDDEYPGWVGVLIALGLVFVAGFILATFVGRRVLSKFELVMGRFPVVKIIYPYARQVVEFFMREKTVQFHSVVAMEYPRKGIYNIGFVTGLGMKTINEATGNELINVFAPTSPTPVTGYVVFVPAEELIPLPITVDEAVRFLISGGVLIPEGQQNPEDVVKHFRALTPPSVKERAEEEPEAAEEPEETRPPA